MTPAQRVWRVVRAASTLEHEPLIARVSKSTGLTHDGVRLALEHLETFPSDADVHTLVSRAGNAERVYVLLSSTVFTAALRAIAVAWAAAEHVVVRPSRRAPDFASALVRAIDAPNVVLSPDLDVAQIEHGEVHVHGRMDTIERVRKGVRAGVIVRAHGPGLGVAVLGAGAKLAHAARNLADDVVVFDQRGCLSPRLVFVLGDAARANAFGSELSAALDEAVPLGELTEEERSAAARWIQAVSYTGVVKRGTGGVVGISEAPLIPPPGRHVHVVHSNFDARLYIEELSAYVTAVGTCGDVDLGIAPPHARVSAFGRMQRPPLDGPVDRRIS